MQLYPTRAAVDLTIAGMATVAVGVVAREAAIVAWGGAVLVGLAVARAVTAVSVARIRAAGFEMLWREEERVRRLARSETVELKAEVRNRDTRAARYVELRPVCSPNLEVELDPPQGEVPAGGRLRVMVKVRAPRVGRHGIHGLSLEVQGSPGLFEVPLTFANPFGFEVLPRPYAVGLRSARGGRSRMHADEGRPSPLAGDGLELKELREHVPGDPFKRIAWKASARRGKLMVREYEREERDVVWLLVDGSVELWSGVLGTSPLDHAIDEAAAVAQRHLARGDRVGLCVVASRPLAWLEAERGPAQGAKIMSALALAPGTLDADRSDLDEADVAVRVLEHLRPLDPAAAQGVRSSELDRLARRVERTLGRAPFSPREPFAHSRRERTLRKYLGAFGIACAARQEAEGQRTEPAMADALTKILKGRPKASIIYVWSPLAELGARPNVEEAISRFPRRKVELRWVGSHYGPSLPREDRLGEAIADAMMVREQISRIKGEAALRRLGVRVEKLKVRHVSADGAPASTRGTLPPPRPSQPPPRPDGKGANA